MHGIGQPLFVVRHRHDRRLLEVVEIGVDDRLPRGEWIDSLPDLSVVVGRQMAAVPFAPVAVAAEVYARKPRIAIAVLGKPSNEACMIFEENWIVKARDKVVHRPVGCLGDKSIAFCAKREDPFRRFVVFGDARRRADNPERRRNAL